LLRGYVVRGCVVRGYVVWGYVVRGFVFWCFVVVPQKNIFMRRKRKFGEPGCYQNNLFVLVWLGTNYFCKELTGYTIWASNKESGSQDWSVAKLTWFWWLQLQKWHFFGSSNDNVQFKKWQFSCFINDKFPAPEIIIFRLQKWQISSSRNDKFPAPEMTTLRL